VLVFLPGEREIREAAQRIGRAHFADTDIFTLYARLGAARQARIFEPGPRRRVILATNVAETSLTVPRVRHVVDTGLARISRYSPRHPRKLQQLPVEKIPQANADQRSGRCGRESAGICIRLYSEEDYLARRPRIEPEIQRTNLAGVVLKLKAMGIADVESFAFAEAPSIRLIKDAYLVLQEIGALDAGRELTALGAQLARFPHRPAPGARAGRRQ
jgi:ATP-dependent helicase HrpA